jgi:pre-mRNA-processing factor 19
MRCLRFLLALPVLALALVKQCRLIQMGCLRPSWHVLRAHKQRMFKERVYQVTTGLYLTKNRLSKTRRKRTIPEGWATNDTISAYKPAQSSEPLYPGGKALAVTASGELALVGGADGAVGIYSVSQKEVVQSLQADGPVTDAVWAGDKAVIASSTGSVRVFENGSEVASFSSHAGAATALAVHATGDIVASVGADKSYVLYDLTTNSVITQIFSDACE